MSIIIQKQMLARLFLLTYKECIKIKYEFEVGNFNMTWYILIQRMEFHIFEIETIVEHFLTCGLVYF